MLDTTSVGIAVAKAKLDVVLRWTDGREAYQQVDNTPAGSRHLSAWLARSVGEDKPLVCLEATGRNGQDIALHL